MATRCCVSLVLALTTTPLFSQLDGSSHQELDPRDLGNLAETGDHFGASLAAGDFDGDGCQDLAIGIPAAERQGNRRR